MTNYNEKNNHENKNYPRRRARRHAGARHRPCCGHHTAETKAIAEEGFIYGLPIVMNYGVMYEYCVDKNSGQYKAPFNKFYNMRRVATPEDTAIVTPNSDTPYSIGFMDLRAEPVVISVPAIDKSRYYSVQLCDGNTFNYGYIGTRATGPKPAITWWPGPTGRARRRRNQEGVQVLDAVFDSDLPHPALQPGGYAERNQNPERLQNATALGLFEAAGSICGTRDQLPEDQQGTGEDRLL